MAGLGQKIKGAAEKVIGSVTGSPNTKLQGELDKAEGQARRDAAHYSSSGHKGSGRDYGTDTTGAGDGTPDARTNPAYSSVMDTSGAGESNQPSTVRGMTETAKGYAEKGMGYMTGDSARQIQGESEKSQGQAERQGAHQSRV